MVAAATTTWSRMRPKRGPVTRPVGPATEMPPAGAPDGSGTGAATEVRPGIPGRVSAPVQERTADGRSHSDTVVGSIVCSTPDSSSAERVSRSTSSRSRALNASTVLAAS